MLWREIPTTSQALRHVKAEIQSSQGSSGGCLGTTQRYPKPGSGGFGEKWHSEPVLCVSLVRNAGSSCPREHKAISILCGCGSNIKALVAGEQGHGEGVRPLCSSWHQGGGPVPCLGLPRSPQPIRCPGSPKGKLQGGEELLFFLLCGPGAMAASAKA